VASARAVRLGQWGVVDDRKDSTPLAALLADLAQGAPPLPGASCRGRARLFDAAMDWDGGSSRRLARRAARRVCASCPCLDQCGSWVEALPQRRRPAGIVAGRLIDASGRWPGRRSTQAPTTRDGPDTPEIGCGRTSRRSSTVEAALVLVPTLESAVCEGAHGLQAHENDAFAAEQRATSGQASTQASGQRATSGQASTQFVRRLAPACPRGGPRRPITTQVPVTQFPWRGRASGLARCPQNPSERDEL
jgi:hypothetical protein